MNESFKKALKFALRWEGGYANHPNDGGGPTNKGITQRTYDAWRQSLRQPCKSIKDITDEEVDGIYYTAYWKAIDADSLPEEVAIAAFDWAVNSGPTRVKKVLSSERSNPDQILKKRETFLKAIGVGKNSVFLKGWLNRIEALKKYLTEEV